MEQSEIGELMGESGEADAGEVDQPSGDSTEASIDNGKKPEELGREVTAATIGRMMGLATGAELKLMEGKIDLLSTRVNNLTTRMEKVLNTLTKMPTGADLDRVDVQIGSLRTLIKDVLSDVVAERETGKDKKIAGTKIMTNAKSDSQEDEPEHAKADEPAAAE